MNRFFIIAVSALPLLSTVGAAAAEEKFDLEYRADSMELPETLGFKSNYQHANSNRDGFSGLMVNDDSRVVLYMDNRGSGAMEYLTYRYVHPSDLSQLTLDFTIRVTDPDSKLSQFMISTVLPDPDREKNRLMLVSLHRDKLKTVGEQPFDAGDDFHHFRLLVDVKSNRFELYDLDSGKLLKTGNAMNADPRSAVNSITFGDGSSTVRGTAELVELRAAFNRLLYPEGVQKNN